jgi:hypothetical protein
MGNVEGFLQEEKEDIVEDKIDSLMRSLEKMEIEKKEAQDVKVVKQDRHAKSEENMAMSTRIPGQPKGPELTKAIQTRSRKETEDPERSAGASKPKPSAEVEEFVREEVTEIVTEELEFEMPGEDTKIPQLKPRYFRGKFDNHFEKFVEVVRRLRINMSLLDVLQVPTYSRYFKHILANKYEIETLGVDHVKMSEQCSAAISNGLEKQKDLGCPTIPCFVGSFKFEKALCDHGASVSVMPRDVFEKLCLPLEPTGMCLGLGDNSIRYPLGITEDVPMKVGHHFIPVDFVILEMGERGRSHLSSLGGLSSRPWELPLMLARGRSCSTLTEKEVPSSFDHASRYAI